MAVRDVSTPQPGPGEIRVRTEACGLCGSDVHAWRADAGYEWVTPPLILGHEAVGRVDAVGDGVSRSVLGRRVVPVSIDGCGACSLCAGGARQICSERTVLGLSFDGAAAESFTIAETRVVEVPEALPAATLALTEPLSVAARAVQHLGTNVGEPLDVVVSGPGPIGLMAALLLRRAGHRVVLTGAARDEHSRLPQARALGVRTAVAGADPLPFPPSGWVEASGSPAAVRAAVAAVVPGSTVSVVGLFAVQDVIDFNMVTRKEIRLQGSYGSTVDDYRTAIRALAAEPALWAALVTELPLESGPDALRQAAAGEAMKTVLTV
ncbi:alcohol dehydrogenase catalytic domain-containing protein [Streptomyces flaveolus]|uniref:2-deoxy-scyllo-inosamine dehydrogenase n=1 Tax=Streptomyces flaveolus TaxID=67297 RepID=A0ABV1VG24_9ACTN